MEFLQTISVPAIMGVVYGIIEWMKTFIENERFRKFIPLVAVLLGSVIGAVAFYIYPSIIPVENVIMAIIIGAVSGGSATCANQVYKQMIMDGDADGNQS